MTGDWHGFSNWDTLEAFTWLQNGGEPAYVACKSATSVEELKEVAPPFIDNQEVDIDKVNWQEIWDDFAEDREETT